ncbi:hypothetical protein TNCV_3662601 [Trichonephila clavipes]|nr:hypothetical protein TNCV_3662601 [Trichonephila clavipes]
MLSGFNIVDSTRAKLILNGSFTCHTSLPTIFASKNVSPPVGIKPNLSLKREPISQKKQSGTLKLPSGKDFLRQMPDLLVKSQPKGLSDSASRFPHHRSEAQIPVGRCRLSFSSIQWDDNWKVPILLRNLTLWVLASY